MVSEAEKSRWLEENADFICPVTRCRMKRDWCEERKKGVYCAIMKGIVVPPECERCGEPKPKPKPTCMGGSGYLDGMTWRRTKTKVCKTCGLESEWHEAKKYFRVIKGRNRDGTYYSGHCLECEKKRKMYGWSYVHIDGVKVWADETNTVYYSVTDAFKKAGRPNMNSAMFFRQEAYADYWPDLIKRKLVTRKGFGGFKRADILLLTLEALERFMLQRKVKPTVVEKIINNLRYGEIRRDNV